MMAYRRFEDYSLIFDEGVFKFKPPKVLLSLWQASTNNINSFMNDLTDMEIRLAKESGVSDIELRHICDLKSLVNYAIKRKFPSMDQKERKKILAADFRPIRSVVKTYEHL